MLSRVLWSEFNFADPVVFLKSQTNDLAAGTGKTLVTGLSLVFGFIVSLMLSVEDIAASLTILRILHLSFVLSRGSLSSAIFVSLSLYTIYKNRQHSIHQYGDNAAVLQQYFLAEDGNTLEYFTVCNERIEMHIGIVENGVCPEGSFSRRPR